MITPQMSGHCAFPQTAHPEESHARCERMGAGNRARPSREFQPCACTCHLDKTKYKCEYCGLELREAPLWPEDPLYPGEPVYTHVVNGRAIGEECP